MPTPMPTPLLEVEDLTVRFPIKGTVSHRSLLAVDQVSFRIERGQTLCLVGESGSGKTTTALAIARLIAATSGRVMFKGDDFFALDPQALRRTRQGMQFIFQDPYSSLNPRLRAEDIVREPLRNAGNPKGAKTQAIIDELFAAVDLHPEQKYLFPHQFSGGQRQRIGIARALATRPELVICDEPVSALDVAMQAQILNLLRHLQQHFALTYLFISHDLRVVQYMADKLAVMYMGRIVESGDRAALFTRPLHPYTVTLLSAVTLISARRERTMDLRGDPPDLTQPQSGCRFFSRCQVAIERCRVELPLLRSVSPKGDHRIACHRVGDDAVAPFQPQ